MKRNPIVFPLDVPSLDEARRLVGTLAEDVGVFKIGLELFSAEGPDGVRALQSEGASKIFLDMKLCDIPATVERAATALRPLRIQMLTAHVPGGVPMLEGAVRGAGPDVCVLGVTRLTSLDAPLHEVVAAANDAAKADCGGVVCSGLEIEPVREAIGPDRLIVCPGVRPAGADRGDQRRVVTPEEAVASGADYIVVGRPIRDAQDPRAAARAILDSL